MSVGSAIILDMQTYQKYTWVCTGDCDALIEYTFKDGFGWPNGVINLTCPCGSNCTLVSQEDATIQPTTNEKENKMETTFGATMTEMSETDKLQSRITQLEEQIQRVTQRDYATAATLNKVRDNMQEFTLEGLDDESLTEFQAEEIASICGFDLTKEFEIEVTVQYSVTVNARNEEQAINSIHEIDFDSVSYNDDSISYLSSSIDRIDV